MVVSGSAFKGGTFILVLLYLILVQHPCIKHSSILLLLMPQSYFTFSRFAETSLAIEFKVSKPIVSILVFFHPKQLIIHLNIIKFNNHTGRIVKNSF
jgi:hypothetical protein